MAVRLGPGLLRWASPAFGSQEHEVEMSEGPATGGRIAVAVMSALWLLGGGLLLLLVAAFGTLACGAICGQLIPAGMVAALAAIAGFVLAVRLVWGAIRRRLSDRLMALAKWADFGLLVVLIGVVVLLGGG